MSGFEPHCQRVGEEISRELVEDLRGRKHACLFLITPFSSLLSPSIPLSVSLTLIFSYSVFLSLSSPPTLCLMHLVSLSLCFYLPWTPKFSSRNWPALVLYTHTHTDSGLTASLHIIAEDV